MQLEFLTMTFHYQPYPKTAHFSECAYCFKSFSSMMKMQKHVLGESCLPKDKMARWIVKFITLEAYDNPKIPLFELSNEIDHLFETIDEEYARELREFDYELSLVVPDD